MTIAVSSFALNDLISGNSEPTAQVIYTATGVHAQIGQLTAYNADTKENSVYVYILPAGTVATAVDPVAVVFVGINESLSITDMIGHVVPDGGTIAVYADVTNVVRITASGNEYSTDI